MRRAAGREPTSENWWRGFFEPLIGEVLFSGEAKQSDREVRRVIVQSKAKPPLRVLDLACGVGRHSLVFAKRGFEVTGLDYSESFLREARRAARKAKQRVDFVRGDMKRLDAHFAAEEFGLVVSLYNSFGYFDHRRDDLRMLKAVHQVLRPGGAFVINTLNGAGVAKRLKHPKSWGSEPLPNVFMIDAPRYDVRRRRTFSSWTIVDARASRARIFRRTFGQNVYTHSELKKLLRAAGFRVERTWGVLAGGDFRASESWHQTILARKDG
jgi:SAM-dependent methyltransferase